MLIAMGKKRLLIVAFISTFLLSALPFVQNNFISHALGSSTYNLTESLSVTITENPEVNVRIVPFSVTFTAVPSGGTGQYSVTWLVIPSDSTVQTVYGGGTSLAYNFKHACDYVIKATVADSGSSQTASAQVNVTAASVAPQNAWIEKAPMHQARAGLGVVAVDDKIYAIGGSTASNSTGPSFLYGGFVGTNEEYDPTKDSWTNKTPMPTPRAQFAIAIYQNKIYCIGGIIGIQPDPIYHAFPTYVISGINEVYDQATDTWETKMPMPISMAVKWMVS